MAAGALSFTKQHDDRVLAGVASGFAAQHGVDVVLVRVAIVVLSFAGGLGILLYALGAVVASPEGADVPEAHPKDLQRTVSVACVSLGLVMLIRSTGLWLGDAVMLPVLVIAAGLVLLWMMRPATAERAAERFASGQLADVASGRHARARLFAGAVLVATGVAMVGLGRSVSNSVRIGAFATSITIIGVALVLGPWLTRLAQQATADRRERIRAAEREAMAAHLHDSVLQTLALIQRTADDPRRTVALARQQERELRDWLYGGAVATAGTLHGAVHAMAEDVEVTYHVRVEVVMVGDRPVDDDLTALVAAMREACVNAAKHSGTDEVSVYVEVAPDAVEAFVRDRGRGFDRGDAAPDRHGIARSIEGRLERVGGTAVIESVVGEGTEVQLRVPVRDTASAGGR
jgi:signal transduction histidine kinase/phage shock protein PspC (stress-responsive transcriptional regulator)